MKNLKHICLTLVLAAVSLAASAQNKMTTGTVLDETGTPVIGASVMVKGSTTGTVTDLDGNFKLDAPKDAVVTISYIGYKSQTVKAGSTSTIKLEEDGQNLEEVVVVGYGVQKKAHLTGSVGTVDTDAIQDLSAGGLASTLSGLVNGLSVSGGDGRPGDNARLYIRDTNALGEVGSVAQEPLFVIDGYIYPNDVKVGNGSQNLGAEAFNNLDPSVIESISVLKDASAAVYGARAANGVILVTTKKGKLGAPKISYSGTFGLTDAVSHPKMLSAYDYGRLYNAVTAADPKNTSLNHTLNLYQADELQAMKGLNYDLLDKYWKTAFTMQHSVNVTGATEKVNYFAGISYFDQDGNLGNLDYNRWNYRAGVDVKLTKYLNVNIGVNGDYGKKNKPNVKVGGSSDEKDYNSLLLRPYYIPEEINGMPITSYGITGGQRDYSQNYSYKSLQDNGDFNNTTNNNMNINAGINYDFSWFKPLKGLTMKFTYSKSINESKNNQYASDFYLYTMQNRTGSGNHLYTPVDGSDYSIYSDPSNFVSHRYVNGTSGDAQTYLSRNMVRTDNYQMNLTVNYARDFGEHHVGALFSIEKSESESEYLMGEGKDIYNFTNFQSNTIGGEKNTVFTHTESGSLSYIGRFNYAYANKYLFEALVRWDSSTKFAPENYWGCFPSFSAGWVVSEEKWFSDNVKWMDYLKLRASWGLTGRDNTAAWQWMRVYAIDANRGVLFGTSDAATGNRITINKNNSAVNRDVHWDKSYKTNFGIDMNFLRSRLGVAFDYYYTRNREMLMNLSNEIPGTVGSQSAAMNVGEMDAWGWELSLNWRDKIGKDFKYKVGLNTGYSSNKVLNMDFEDEYIYRQIVRGGRTDIGVWGMQCIGMFRSFQDIEEYFEKYHITSYMGMAKDKVRPGMLIYKDVRGPQQPDGTYAAPDGIVDKDNDQIRLSKYSSNPYGFTTNLSGEWKGLSLTAQISASWGADRVIPTSALKPDTKLTLEGGNMPSFWSVDKMYSYSDVVDGNGNVVVKANQDAWLPNLAYSNVNSVESSYWTVSAARVTLNRLTLAYSLPKKFIQHLPVSSVRFNVTGQNLINFYNPYPDNFINSAWGTYGKYPTLRKWTIGVNIGF